MNAPAAISGEFSTFKHVPTRKVYQLIIEIPSEAAESMFATLGTPGGSEQITVGIARIDPRSAAPVAKPEEAKPERRAFTDLPYAQQAAMRCQEPEFHEFLLSKTGDAGSWRSDKPRSEVAAMAVRYLCEVSSRADIMLDTAAGQRWAALEAEYWAWQRGRR